MTGYCLHSVVCTVEEWSAVCVCPMRWQKPDFRLYRPHRGVATFCYKALLLSRFRQVRRSRFGGFDGFGFSGWLFFTTFLTRRLRNSVTWHLLQAAMWNNDRPARLLASYSELGNFSWNGSTKHPGITKEKMEVRTHRHGLSCPIAAAATATAAIIWWRSE